MLTCYIYTTQSPGTKKYIYSFPRSRHIGRPSVASVDVLHVAAGCCTPYTHTHPTPPTVHSPLPKIHQVYTRYTGCSSPLCFLHNTPHLLLPCISSSLCINHLTLLGYTTNKSPHPSLCIKHLLSYLCTRHLYTFLSIKRLHSSLDTNILFLIK